MLSQFSCFIIYVSSFHNFQCFHNIEISLSKCVWKINIIINCSKWLKSKLKNHQSKKWFKKWSNKIWKNCNFLTKTRFLKNIFELIRMCVFLNWKNVRKIYVKVEEFSWKSSNNVEIEITVLRNYWVKYKWKCE